MPALPSCPLRPPQQKPGRLLLHLPLHLLLLLLFSVWTAAGIGVAGSVSVAAATGAGAHTTAPEDWWIALANDRSASIQQWLAQGTSPNVITATGMPALMQAVRDQAWASVDLLLAHPQLDLDATNAVDETALMYLAIVGDADRAARLIERGAQVNRLGWTPLHYAAARAQSAVMHLLLAHAAMVNAPAPDGTSPLMMAAYSGSRETVQTLLDAGADLLMRNRQGRNAVGWALSARHDELANTLEIMRECVFKHRNALRKRGVDAAPVELNARCVRSDR